MSETGGGESVIDRLYTFGLWEEWEAAARSRNRATMLELMVKVGMSNEYAAKTVDTVLSDPTGYGY